MSLGRPENEHQVIPFRARAGKRRSRNPDKLALLKGGTASPVRNLAQYQRSPGRDDYGHRMKMNAVVMVLTSVLVMAGVWLVTLITHPHS